MKFITRKNSFFYHRFRLCTTAAGVLWCMLSALTVSAQTPEPKTARTLTFSQMLQLVLNYHPVVQQANLLPAQAQAEILAAKGAFDPSLDIHWNRKDLWNKDSDPKWQPATYFTNWNNFLKVPVWVGDLKMGFERYKGINVNPENFTPPDGLIYAQLELPLAQNLLIDERRAVLLQAQNLVQYNAAEQLKIINKVLLQATKEYWEWAAAWQRAELSREAYTLALDQFRFIGANIELGANAGIDSIEARLSLLKRENALQEAELSARNAALRLSTHLWNPNGDPLELTEEARPQEMTQIASPNLAQRDSLMTDAGQNHPEVQKLTVKRLMLDIDKRLQRNYLLPNIDMDAKAMWIPGVARFETRYFQENYKIGFNFYMPLFLRKTRGKIQSINLKITQNDLELTAIRREITNEIKAAYNEVQVLEQLIRLQTRTVEYASTLRQAETTRLTNGESSLFLTTRRDLDWLDARSKSIELDLKYLKALATLYWAAGRRLDLAFSAP